MPDDDALADAKPIPLGIFEPTEPEVIPELITCAGSIALPPIGGGSPE